MIAVREAHGWKLKRMDERPTAQYRRLSATGSWAGRTATRFSRRRASSTCRTSRCSRRSWLATPNASRRSPATGATSRWKPIGGRLVERKDIDLIDIASPNDTHAEIADRRGPRGKMVMCEKPLGRTAAEAQTMVAAVEAAGVANMVWYNYRRVPAVVAAQDS